MKFELKIRFVENGWDIKFLKPLPKYNVITTQRFNTSFTLSVVAHSSNIPNLFPFARQINAYGLNGAINGGGGGGMGPPRTPGAATTNSSSHPRSSAGEESDEHDYYNDFDRLKVSELHFHQSKCPLCNHDYF